MPHINGQWPRTLVSEIVPLFKTSTIQFDLPTLPEQSRPGAVYSYSVIYKDGSGSTIDRPSYVTERLGEREIDLAPTEESHIGSLQIEVTASITIPDAAPMYVLSSFEETDTIATRRYTYTERGAVDYDIIYPNGTRYNSEHECPLPRIPDGVLPAGATNARIISTRTRQFALPWVTSSPGESTEDRSAIILTQDLPIHGRLRLDSIPSGTRLTLGQQYITSLGEIFAITQYYIDRLVLQGVARYVTRTTQGTRERTRYCERTSVIQYNIVGTSGAQGTNVEYFSDYRANLLSHINIDDLSVPNVVGADFHNNEIYMLSNDEGTNSIKKTSAASTATSLAVDDIATLPASVGQAAAMTIINKNSAAPKFFILGVVTTTQVPTYTFFERNFGSATLANVGNAGRTIRPVELTPSTLDQKFYAVATASVGNNIYIVSHLGVHRLPVTGATRNLERIGNAPKQTFRPVAAAATGENLIVATHPVGTETQGELYLFKLNETEEDRKWARFGTLASDIESPSSIVVPPVAVANHQVTVVNNPLVINAAVLNANILPAFPDLEDVYDKSVRLGNTWSFTLPALQNLDARWDADNVTFYLQSQPLPPDGLFFDTPTNTLSWTPSAEQCYGIETNPDTGEISYKRPREWTFVVRGDVPTIDPSNDDILNVEYSFVVTAHDRIYREQVIRDEDSIRVHGERLVYPRGYYRWETDLSGDDTNVVDYTPNGEPITAAVPGDDDYDAENPDHWNYGLKSAMWQNSTSGFFGRHYLEAPQLAHIEYPMVQDSEFLLDILKDIEPGDLYHHEVLLDTGETSNAVLHAMEVVLEWELGNIPLKHVTYITTPHKDPVEITKWGVFTTRSATSSGGNTGKIDGIVSAASDNFNVFVVGYSGTAPTTEFGIITADNPIYTLNLNNFTVTATTETPTWNSRGMATFTEEDESYLVNLTFEQNPPDSAALHPNRPNRLELYTIGANGALTKDNANRFLPNYVRATGGRCDQ